MSNFADEQEAQRYVGGVFEDALADGRLGPKLAATGMVLRVKICEPDAVVLVDLPNKKVYHGDFADLPIDATLIMSGEFANKFWQGKANPMAALASRKIQIDGQVTALARLQPSSQTMFRAYRKRLEDEGRSDLLL